MCSCLSALVSGLEENSILVLSLFRLLLTMKIFLLCFFHIVIPYFSLSRCISEALGDFLSACLYNSWRPFNIQYYHHLLQHSSIYMIAPLYHTNWHVYGPREMAFGCMCELDGSLRLFLSLLWPLDFVSCFCNSSLVYFGNFIDFFHLALFRLMFPFNFYVTGANAWFDRFCWDKTATFVSETKSSHELDWLCRCPPLKLKVRLDPWIELFKIYYTISYFLYGCFSIGLWGLFLIFFLPLFLSAVPQ